MTVYERRVRWYQAPLWRHLTGVQDCRAIEIAHRRWGKDEIVLGATNERMHKRVGTYWHCLPEYGQARKAIWEAINAHTGKRRIDEAFPPETRRRTLNQEMFIELINGSTWQCIGSDRYDATVGAGPVFIAYSEWALANPSAWAYHRPMLEENGGGAAFITTPRGRNHAYALFDRYSRMAKENPRYFAELSNVMHTGALTEAQQIEALAEYCDLYGEDLGRAQFEQEYLCSFNAAILGAFYAREMLAVRAEGRIDDTLEAADAPVHRAWDLGMRDDTSIWFWQVVGGQVFVLDCYSSSGVGLDHYAEVIEQRHKEHGWEHGTDWVPHDAKVKELGTGRTRVETLQSLGLAPRLVPNAGLMDGINALRQSLPRMVFHPRCEPGLAALEQYRREWNDDQKTFRASPLHDWCFTAETPIVTRHGMCQIGSLPSKGEVLTPCGWKPYENPRITRTAARLVEVVFADGLSVKCTPDHMFKTVNGWRSAESLAKGSKIQSSWTASRSISWAACIACGRAKSILQRAARGFTGTFGRMLMALFPKDAISTTGMPMFSTTRSTTLNACLHPITEKRPMLIDWLEDTRAKLVHWLALRPQTGIDQKRAGSGTANTPRARKTGLSGFANPVTASIAAKSFSASFAATAIRTSIAALTAKPLIIESVRPVSYLSDVWCITVPGEEAFSLSNGAVVHNCSHYADAARYLALAWRAVKPEKPKEQRPDPLHQPGALRLDAIRGRNRRGIRV